MKAIVNEQFLSREEMHQLTMYILEKCSQPGVNVDSVAAQTLQMYNDILRYIKQNRQRG